MTTHERAKAAAEYLMREVEGLVVTAKSPCAYWEVTFTELWDLDELEAFAKSKGWQPNQTESVPKAQENGTQGEGG